jgi:hypothetical protein
VFEQAARFGARRLKSWVDAGYWPGWYVASFGVPAVA